MISHKLTLTADPLLRTVNNIFTHCGTA